jgi:uncharacterized surface protein with fasciclin (FAS1) repeats
MKKSLIATAIVLAAAAAQAKDIVDTAVAAGDFKTLAAALQKAINRALSKSPGSVAHPSRARDI